MKFVKHPQHIAIAGRHPAGHLTIIHAYQPSGKVVEQALDNKWLNKIIGIYNFKRGAF